MADETTPPPPDRIPPAPDPEAVPDGDPGPVVSRRVRRRFGWFGRREEAVEMIDDDSEPEPDDK
jgi:hypothetical protein